MFAKEATGTGHYHYVAFGLAQTKGKLQIGPKQYLRCNIFLWKYSKKIDCCVCTSFGQQMNCEKICSNCLAFHKPLSLFPCQPTKISVELPLIEASIYIASARAAWPLHLLNQETNDAHKGRNKVTTMVDAISRLFWLGRRTVKVKISFLALS